MAESKFPLPIPNSNSPAEIARVMRIWAQRIGDTSGDSSASSTSSGSGSSSGTGGGGGGGTTPDDLTDYLLWVEKPSYVSAWAQAEADKPVLDNQADQAGVDRTDYDTKYDYLDKYLHDTGTAPNSKYYAQGKNWLTAGWSTINHVNKYLGPGGRVYWNSKWSAYLQAAQALRDAIANAGLSGGGQGDIIRPILIWDFFGTALPTQPASGNGYNPANVGPTNVTKTSGGDPTDGTDHTYSSFAPGGTTAQKHNFPTQNVIFQTVYNSVYGATPATYTAGIPVRDGYLVVLRCRWDKVAGVGSWQGKVTPTVSSGGTLSPVVVAVPAQNEWKTLVWDLRGASFNSGANITGFLVELMDGGKIELDFCILGCYGGGSRMDYDSLVSLMATLSMMRADFVDPATGKIPGNTKIKDDSITTPLLAANSIFAKQLTVGNFDNLVINGNSQYIPNPDWTSVGGSNAGIEGVKVYSGAAGTGFGNSTRCRRLTSETAVITNPIPAAVGEVYALYAFVNSESGATGTIVAEYSADGVTGWTNITLGAAASSNAIGWNDGASPPVGNAIGNSFTVPSGTGYIRVSLTATGGTAVRFDNIYLRKCADARLIVDGGILTRHLSAGAVQAWQANFGPNYQFFSRDTGGNPLFQTADGALKRPADDTEWNPRNENATDPGYYADPNRLYPSGTGIPAARFEATFYGVSSTTANRSIITALDDDFAPTLGLELARLATSLQLYKITGISTGTRVAVGSAISMADPGAAYEKISLVLYNPTDTTADNLRAEVFVNGKSVKKYTRTTDLPNATWGTTWNSGSGYYSAVRLGTTGLKMAAIAMGGGNVTIESGVITADKLEAILALLSELRSSNPAYEAPGSGNGYIPQGFRISGQQFNSTLSDGAGGAGTTLTDCVAEFGGSININGRKAGSTIDRVWTPYNRFQNSKFYKGYWPGAVDTDTGTAPWNTGGANPAYGGSSYATSDGTGCLIQYCATTGSAVRKYGGFATPVTIPPLGGATVNLTFKILCEVGSLVQNPDGRVVVKVIKPDMSVVTLATYNYSSDFNDGATSKTISGIQSNLSTPGDYLFRFEIGSYAEYSGSGTAAANSMLVGIDELGVLI